MSLSMSRAPRSPTRKRSRRGGQESVQDYRSFDIGDRGRGMRYGRYRKPFPLDVIKVLNPPLYTGGLLQFGDYLFPTDVGAKLPKGRDLYSANRKRLTYTATGQWDEQTPGQGSARHSNAYTQFAGMGDLGDDIKTIINNAVGGKLQQVSEQLDKVETALKVSTGASILGAAVALFVAFGKGR